MTWRKIEEFAVCELVLLIGAAIGWAVVVVGLSLLGVL